MTYPYLKNVKRFRPGKLLLPSVLWVRDHLTRAYGYSHLGKVPYEPIAAKKFGLLVETSQIFFKTKFGANWLQNFQDWFYIMQEILLFPLAPRGSGDA